MLNDLRRIHKLTGSLVLDANQFRKLNCLDDVVEIDLSSPSLDASNFAQLKRMQRVKVISLGNYADDKWLLELAKHPTLESIMMVLKSGQVTDEGLHALALLPNLKTLSLVTDDHVILELPPLAFLQTIKIEGFDVTDKCLKSLTRHPELESVVFYNTNVDLTEAGSLSRLPKLESLNVDQTPVKDSGIPEIVACSALVDLNLRLTKVTSDGIKQLAALPHLRYLNATVEGPGGRSEMVRALAACPASKSWRSTA